MLIARGEFGEIYSCDFEGKKAAVKIQSLSRSVLVECDIISRCHHPNIISPYKVDLSADTGKNIVLITMPLASCTLLDYKGNQQKNFMSDIANAMYFLHKNGIMHCDIKLENILIFSDEKAVLSDFGLSQFVSNEKQYYRDGSYVYDSPEMEKKLRYGPPADVYAFGLTLKKMHILPELTLKCLDENPDSRITSEQIVEYFGGKKDQGHIEISIPKKLSSKEEKIFSDFYPFKCQRTDTIAKTIYSKYTTLDDIIDASMTEIILASIHYGAVFTNETEIKLLENIDHIYNDICKKLHFKFL